MNAIVSALSAENEGEAKAPPSEHDHLFTTLWIIVQTSFCGEVGFGIWCLKQRQQHRQTHERLYMSYILKLQNSSIPSVMVDTWSPSSPKLPPFTPWHPVWHIYESHTENLTSFSGPNVSMFRDLYHHYQCYKNRRWRGSKWSGWANAYPWKPKEIGERFFEH